MGIREIVGAGVTAFIGIYMVWFVIPITKKSYDLELASVNKTSALMQTILPITNNWWVIFPLLIAIICGYTIFQYATNRDAFDY